MSDTNNQTRDVSVSGPEKMAEIFQKLHDELPSLDYERVRELVSAIGEFPASGKRLALKKFTFGSESEKALAYLVLAECGVKVVDDLNAVVFDSSQSDEIKVRAHELLTELGSPIDRDVLETTVARHDEIAANSLWQAARDLEQGNLEESLRRMRSLDPATRAVIAHRMARKDVARAVPLLDSLSADDENSAVAAISALSQFPTEAAVNILARLARSESRTVQKTARTALHSMRASGFEVPEEDTYEAASAAAEEASAEEKAEPVIFKAAIGEVPGGKMALVMVAREYPNGRLQTLTVAVSPWKRGIVGAKYRLDMSKSRFRRELDERVKSGLLLRDAPVEECRRLVARGIRAAKEVGTPIPFDVQAGKHILGDVMGEAESLESAFVCSKCAAVLPAETASAIKDAAMYDQLEVNTLCEGCRKA